MWFCRLHYCNYCYCFIFLCIESIEFHFNSFAGHLNCGQGKLQILNYFPVWWFSYSREWRSVRRQSWRDCTCLVCWTESLFLLLQLLNNLKTQNWISLNAMDFRRRCNVKNLIAGLFSVFSSFSRMWWPSMLVLKYSSSTLTWSSADLVNLFNI